MIDEIVAGEGHETNGNPVQMNLVIAGTGAVAADAVGAAVMDIPLESVKHLRLIDSPKWAPKLIKFFYFLTLDLMFLHSLLSLL